MDVTRAFLPHLRRTAYSAEKHSVGIINVSSGIGVYTIPTCSLYAASKFAVEGFTEALSYELTSQNIDAKLVIPHGGITQTSFQHRAAQEAAKSDAEVNAAYQDFLAKSMATMGRMMAATKTTSDEVAQTIFESATDGKDTLRYWIGNDWRGFFKFKFGEKGLKADEEYVAAMRKYFA